MVKGLPAVRNADFVFYSGVEEVEHLCGGVVAHGIEVESGLTLHHGVIRVVEYGDRYRLSDEIEHQPAKLPVVGGGDIIEGGAHAFCESLSLTAMKRKSDTGRTACVAYLGLFTLVILADESECFCKWSEIRGGPFPGTYCHAPPFGGQLFWTEIEGEHLCPLDGNAGGVRATVESTGGFAEVGALELREKAFGQFGYIGGICIITESGKLYPVIL